MKKTLALILALIMILSVALVACGEKEEETQPNDDFFGDLETPGDETGEGDETNESGVNIPTTNSTFVAMNDTVYVCYNAVIRKDAKATSSQVATATFGTALSRIEANSKWSKVKVGDVEGYIANDLISTNSGAVTFTKLETPETAKIVNLGNSSNANLRKFPLALSDPKVVDLESFNSSCIIGQVAKNSEVTIISTSGDGQWAYIKCTGKVRDAEDKFTIEKEIEGYCSMGVLSYNSGNSSSGSNDFLG